MSFFMRKERIYKENIISNCYVNKLILIVNVFGYLSLKN